MSAKEQMSVKKKESKSTDKISSRHKSTLATAKRDNISLGDLFPHLNGLLPNRVRSFLLRGVGHLGVLTARAGRIKNSAFGIHSAKSGDDLSPILQATFHESLPAALEAYKVFNKAYPLAEKELDTSIIGRAIEFGYLQWPRRIRKYVQGKDIVDVGCGTGLHGIGYIVIGVKSYTGIDPNLKLDDDRAKKDLTKRDLAKRGRANAKEIFGWTPRQIMNQFSRIKLVNGTFEGFRSEQTFEVAVLHNVTEHLLNIDEVLRSTAACLRDDGIILFTHHNFYCWNGHHRAPMTVDQIKKNDPEQKNYIDWGHIRFEPPEGHYFRYGLNRITLDRLRAIVDRYYHVDIWEETPSNKRDGGGRLTEETIARFPELSRRDLEIRGVFCVAKRKKRIS